MKGPSGLKWDSRGLLPAIVQHAGTARVLMLGYFSRASLARTLQTGRVTFFSRSRGRLWEKGETSGHFLELVSLHPDCDRDALLLRARPRGPTCHLGRESCFQGEESAIETVGQLIEVVRDRAGRPRNDSYTCRLLRAGREMCAAKLLEEAGEVVRALAGEGRQRVLEEVADLLYHFLVLLREQEIELEEVARVLRGRKKES